MWLTSCLSATHMTPGMASVCHAHLHVHIMFYTITTSHKGSMTYMYICCSFNPLPTCTCMHLTLTLYVCTIISGTKNASKEIKKVCAGPKRTEGKIWFSELADKSMIFTSMH